MTFRIPNELVEVEWLVNAAQVIVVKSLVRVVNDPLELRFNGLSVIVGGHLRFGEEFQEPARLANFFGGRLKTRCMEAYHSAHQIPKMIAWISVIADVSDPV